MDSQWEQGNGYGLTRSILVTFLPATLWRGVLPLYAAEFHGLANADSYTRISFMLRCASALKIVTVWLLLASGVLFAQNGPAFEVASVKPAGSYTAEDLRAGKAHVGVKVDGARVDMGSLTMSNLIARAYRVRVQQVLGPDWLNSAKFDILAKMPEGASPDQVPEMLQALLAERFKLAVHREEKEYEVFALLVGRSGPKLKEAAADAKPSLRPSVKADGTVRMEFTNNMEMFANFLALFMRRQVVDQTGLKGVYQGGIDVPRATALDGNNPIDLLADPFDSPFFAAVSQIGLKLELRKVPMETIVVDHAEKNPAEN